MGALRILEAIRLLELTHKTRFYQAATSEQFGQVQQIPQTEKTPFHPRSPYAAAKLFAYWITITYREAYHIFACNGILFNHESPRRGETFVTRKITRAACRIKLGLQDVLYLGNLDAKRDWGYAKDYVEAMWLMLQQETAQDFVIATGRTSSVRKFVELALKEVGIPIAWRGEGINEEGYNPSNGKVLVKIDPYYFRPSEVDILIGDCSKAKQILKWEPTTDLQELVKIMIMADMKAEQQAQQISKLSCNP